MTPWYFPLASRTHVQTTGALLDMLSKAMTPGLISALVCACILQCDGISPEPPERYGLKPGVYGRTNGADQIEITADKKILVPDTVLISDSGWTPGCHTQTGPECYHRWAKLNIDTMVLQDTTIGNPYITSSRYQDGDSTATRIHLMDEYTFQANDENLGIVFSLIE